MYFSPFSLNRWDPNGIELLVCTRKGAIKVFSMRESLLNCWSCLYSSSLNGERVLTAKWFHSGPKLVFGGSNSASAASDAADRFSFSVTAFSPTLTGFGASARSGFVLVTATGLIKVRWAVVPRVGYLQSWKLIFYKRIRCRKSDTDI